MADVSHPVGSADGAPKESQKPAESNPTSGWVIPVVTALILAAGFCMYYFVYVGARREYLANRNFRALALLGEQLQESISIHSQILDFCADLLAPPKTAANEKKLDARSFLIVHHEDAKLPEGDKEREALKDYLKYLAPSFELNVSPREAAGGHGADRSAAQALRVERHEDRWELVLRSFQGAAAGGQHYQGSLRLDDLIRPLVASQPFDDILLVSQEGFIVYHSKESGPQFTTLTSLLQAQIGGTDDKADTKPAGDAKKTEAPAATAARVVIRNEDPTWRARSLHLTELTLAGTRYKLFLQPVLISAYISGADAREPASEWVLCGLRASSSLDWEALSLSYTFFIWFTAIFFIIWTSYKALKLFFMNQWERLKLRELGLLGVSLVFLTAALTLALLQLDFHVNDDTETQLRRLGASISANIRDELGDMARQLTEWCGPRYVTNAKDGDLHAVASGKRSEIIRNWPPDGKPAGALDGGNISTVPEGPKQYPFVNNAFWTNDDGLQIVKWSATQYVTPMIDISQLPLFARPSMYLSGSAAPSPPFQFVSSLPPNKLEYMATFGMKTAACAPGLRGIPEDIAGGSAFVSAEPLSLIDPILPYGYGFALVDQTGMVQFHSDKTRNGRENFLTESDGSRELYAAVFSHASQHSLSLTYMGRDHRALVLPVTGVSRAPWSLIVFRDMTAARTLNLQVMTLASSMLLLLLAGPVIVVAIWCASLRPRFAPEWFWPNRRRARAYVSQIYAYALLIALFLPVVSWGSTEAILIACAAVPWAVLFVSLWCFRRHRPEAMVPRVQPGRAALAAGAGLALTGGILLGALVLHSGRWIPLILAVLAASVIAPPRRLAGRLERWLSASAAVEEDLHPETASLAYRTCYVSAVLLLLLLIGVLMPMALFRASLDAERRLGIKQAQLRLATAVAQRWTSIVERHDSSDISDAAWTALQDIRVWRRIVPDTLGPANEPLRVESQPAGAPVEHFAAWLRRLLYVFHHDYNDPSAEMLAVIQDSGNHPDWSWKDDDAGITLRWHGAYPQPVPDGPSSPPGDLLITSVLPGFSWYDGWTYLAIAAAVMLAAGGLLWTLARKVFLFHIAPLKISGTREAAEALREGRNVLILLPPVSGWQLESSRKTVDVSALRSMSDWNESLVDILSAPPNTLMELQHFEFTAGDAELDDQKFVLLERLLKRENTQVAVVMTVPASGEDYRRRFPGLEVIDLREEPFQWLKQYQGRAQELIWKECGPMAALWPLGSQLARDLRTEEDQTEDTIASEILERADPYYRMIWDECSVERKFVLSQLAADGVLNPANGRAIRQLIRRGLITKDPQFRIMNESFRRFLRSATTPQLRQQWLHDSRRSGWGRTHGAFFITMTMLGVFLLATQNALWQSAAAYVTTALGGLGTLTKVLDMIRGKAVAEKG